MSVNEDKIVRVSIPSTPVLHVYLTFSLRQYTKLEGEGRGVEYTEPKTTDQLVVEIPYEESREYRGLQTTDGY